MRQYYSCFLSSLFSIEILIDMTYRAIKLKSREEYIHR